MRPFIGILMVISYLASGAAQCPDFSGQYTLFGEDGQVDITIMQSDCKQIRIERRANYLGTITAETHVLVLDGQFHDDTSWYGAVDKVRTAARLYRVTLNWLSNRLLPEQHSGRTPMSCFPIRIF